VRRVVVDCSLAISWFFPEEGDAYSQGIYQVFSSGAIAPVAPEFFLVECGNVFLRKAKTGHCTFEEAAHQLQKLMNLPLRYFNNRALLPRAFTLARLANTTVYDALYLALAVELRAPLATLDKKLAAAAKTQDVLYSV
jgi:predicted nucleic acid-binding protein